MKIVRKIEKEATLAGIFPPFQGFTSLTQELFERFFAIYGIPQGANREVLEEAGDVDDDYLEILCEDSKCSFNR